MAPTLTSEAWTQIRFDYEHSERPIAEICAEHGISSGTLRDRMRRWGWRRRRPPIPREGPPALPAPVAMPPVAGVALRPSVRASDVEGPSDLNEDSPHPARLRFAQACAPLRKGEDEGGGAVAPEHDGDETAIGIAPAWRSATDGKAGAFAQSASEPAADVAVTRQIASGEDAARGESDDAALAPRLKAAAARVLPAIEAIVDKLAAGALHPREMERAGRALGVLTRTLRELNALLGERRPPVAADAADGGRSPPPDETDDGGPRDMEEFRQELIRRINAIIAAREENAAEGAPAAEADDPLR